MDVNSKAVHEACTDLLKCGQRQMRYRLKKQYFDGVLANQVRTMSPSVLKASPRRRLGDA